MKNAITVFKKEFYRVVSDKRLLLMSVLFPGIMIFFMYSLMGNVMESETQEVQEHTMVIYAENMPTTIETMLGNMRNYTDLNDDGEVGDEEYTLLPVDMHTSTELTKQEIEDKILAGEIDIYLSFPADFETNMTNFEDPSYVIPMIDILYNPGERYSENTYYNVQSVLSSYAQAINLDRFGDNVYPFYQDTTVIINEQQAAGRGFAMLLPMLIVMFLFSGAMSIGPDSIAGEKERGTIATLLVTPVKRFEIAVGKVMSLSVISLMSAASSFVGIIFGLNNLMGSEAELSADIYGINEYLMIILTLFATVLVIVGIISVVSTYARTIKEASMLILPFYFISIIIGVTSMFSGEAATDTVLYLIPIYSSVNILISILTFEVVPVQLLIMVGSNIVYVSILIYIMNRLFQSEKVMFSK
jgi:sodium transport system permease protein